MRIEFIRIQDGDLQEAQLSEEEEAMVRAMQSSFAAIMMPAVKQVIEEDERETTESEKGADA